MNPEFEECQKKGKIKEFSRGKALANKELNTAEFDLNKAKKSFHEGDYKWATIQMYYSMFHSGRALLYNQSLRERSHWCLIIALRALYVEKGLLSGILIEALVKAKNLREDADYYDRWSKESCEKLLSQAEEFYTKSKQILSERIDKFSK